MENGYLQNDFIDINGQLEQSDENFNRKSLIKSPNPQYARGCFSLDTEMQMKDYEVSDFGSAPFSHGHEPCQYESSLSSELSSELTLSPNVSPDMKDFAEETESSSFYVPSTISKKHRKGSIPSKSLPANSIDISKSGIPGLVFKMPFGQQNLKVIKYPTEFEAYQLPSKLVKRRRPCFRSKEREKATELAARKEKQIELFLRKNQTNRCGTDSEIGKLVPRRRRSSTTSFVTDARNEAAELGSQENAEPNRRKRKLSTSLRRRRTRTDSEKVCASCETTVTPIWREVRENWGDGWENIMLCNACGLRKF